MPEIVVYDPNRQFAPLPKPQRAPWLQQAQGMMMPYQPPVEQVTLMGEVIANLESVLVGGTLGVLSELNGGSLEVKGISVDLAAGSVFSALGVAFNSKHAAQVAHSCSTVYGYRKVGEAVKLLRALRGEDEKEVSTVAGEKTVTVDADPIVAKAKEF